MLALKTLPASYFISLFNRILSQGKFPASYWTENFILTTYKSGDPNDLNNYRGIGIGSCSGKLFSLILNACLNDF